MTERSTCYAALKSCLNLLHFQKKILIFGDSIVIRYYDKIL